MDVDAYRFAYNVLHRNWIRFGIPEEDIPPPKTEEVDSLNAIIPSFSIAAVLYQIASRKDLKNFLDNECPTVHNLNDLFSRFQMIMDAVLPNGSKDIDSPDDTASGGLPKHAVDEDLSQGPMRECLSEDNLSEDTMQANLQKEAVKKGLCGDMFLYENIPAVIAYSLAVCTELVLYEREGENNKDRMKCIPDMWKKYFDENLKPLCEKSGCTQDHLKDFIDGIKCPDEFLNRFISENKNEYNKIAEKFCDYTKRKYAEESPEHMKVLREAKAFSKGLYYPKMRITFRALKNICKCVHSSPPSEELPLISSDSSSSTSTTPSSEAETLLKKLIR